MTITRFLFVLGCLLLGLRFGPRLEGQAPPTAIPHRSVFTTQAQVYKLSGVPAPGGAVQVFVNGLLMSPGIDYTLVGATLTFTAQQIGDSPVIQVFYWTLAS